MTRRTVRGTPTPQGRLGMFGRIIIGALSASLALAPMAAAAGVDPVARGLAASALRPDANAKVKVGSSLPTAASGPSLAFPAATSGGAPRLSSSGKLFNTTPDPAIYVGVNEDAYGGRVDTGYHSVAYGLENNYNDGTSVKQEAYLQFHFTDDTIFRPFFWQVEPSSKTITGTQIRVGSDGLRLKDDQTTGLDLGGNLLAQFTYGATSFFPKTGAVNSLSLGAATGQTSIVYWGFNNVGAYLSMGPTAANLAAINLNGTTPIVISAASQGNTGAVAISVGESNNVSAGLFRAGFAGHKGLIAKGFSAGQTANLFEAEDSSGNPLIAVTAKGHLSSGGTAPALTSCGTSPTIAGSDTAGEVTTGTATPTACTITFANAYAAQPYCVVADRTALANLTSYTVSTSAIVLTTTAASSQKITYVCVGS